MAKKKSRKKASAVGTFFKVFFICIVLVLVIVIGVITGSLVGYVNDIPLIDVNNLSMNLSSHIYYTDPDTGEDVELETLYDDENRVWVSINKIPQYLQDAFVAIEDERFYQHHGFDLKRIVGAGLTYIKQGEAGYGASTITQQLIKNLTNEDEVKIQRKVREIYRAYNLEKQLSKKEILELYLNTIYLSQSCNGVQAAARTYFGKDVGELSLAECASIASITQFPTRYDPIQHPDNNKSRQEVVLKKMLELGFITQDEYDSAIAEELDFSGGKTFDTEIGQNSYFVDAVVDELLDELIALGYNKTVANAMLYSGGLKIYTTVDTRIQGIIDDVYQDPSSFPTYRNSEVTQPESAIVIIENSTGYVRGLCGGRGTKEAKRTLNRATQSLRQPGSSIKPLSVYGPGIEYGYITPSTVVTDSPVTFGKWSPKNSGGGHRGNMTIREAIMRSTNVVAVKVLNYIGIETSYKFITQNMHISTLVETDKALAPLGLGGLTNGVKVIEMAAAYATFPNRGLYNRPTTYSKVLNSNGDVLIDHTPAPTASMSEQSAYLMCDMLRGVVSSGTGTAAGFSGQAVAGKTGTTSDNYDRWFCGFTPYYTAAVWFGFDQPQSVAYASGNPSAATFRKVMSRVHEGLPNVGFSKPGGGTTTCLICSETGMLASSECPNVVSEEFATSAAPRSHCTLHSSGTYGSSPLIDRAWVERAEKLQSGEWIYDEEGNLIENPDYVPPVEGGDGVAPEDGTMQNEGGQTAQPDTVAPTTPSVTTPQTETPSDNQTTDAPKPQMSDTGL